MWSWARKWLRLERRESLRAEAAEAAEAARHAEEAWPEVHRARRTFTAEAERAFKRAQGHGA